MKLLRQVASGAASAPVHGSLTSHCQQMQELSGSVPARPLMALTGTERGGGRDVSAAAHAGQVCCRTEQSPSTHLGLTVGTLEPQAIRTGIEVVCCMLQRLECPNQAACTASGVCNAKQRHSHGTAPRTSQPASPAVCSVRMRLVQECRGSISRAPLDALATAGDRGAEFLAQHSTPAAPRK